MLSASITLHRRRKDGVGIKSADVVFALGDNNYAPPDDGEVWKSLVSDLILAAGKYLWSCTKIIKTNGDMAYTGKYCLGYSLDYADAVEMYYLSTSGTTIPDPTKVSFSLTYTTKKGYYLWTCVRYTSYGKVSYSTPRCNSYFPNDGTNGTSFTPKGEANEHFALSSEITDKTAGKVYLVDKNDTSTPVISAPCVVRLTQSSGETVIWNSKKAETGDAYMIGATLWVNNGSAWVQFGQIQGPAGEAGEDALIAEVNPNPTVFQTNDKGAIVNLFGTAAIKVYLGSANVTKRCNFELVTDKNTFSNFTVGESSVDIKSTDVTDAGKGLFFFCNAITTDPVSVENNGNTETYNVARTAGYFTIKCIYGDRVCYAKVQFSVSVSAFFRSYIETDYEMRRQYQQLKDTTVTTSTFEQRAGKIEASVKTVQDGLETKAGIDVAVQKVKGSDGKYYIESGVGIYADKININADHSMNITAGCLTFDTPYFKLDGNGNVTCINGNFQSITVDGNSTFKGKLEGVNGSFTSLECRDDKGNKVILGNGTIYLEGDIYSQGYNYDEKRGHRFYASNIWCRNAFGHRAKTVAVVQGTTMNVYINGIDSSFIRVSLKTGISPDNFTYCEIPLFGDSNSGFSGMPIDLVVINVSDANRYAFTGLANGKEWKVVNGNNKFNSVYFADIGGWHQLNGGSAIDCLYIAPSLLTPVPATNKLGRGVFWTGEYDLNWG